MHASSEPHVFGIFLTMAITFLETPFQLKVYKRSYGPPK
jgi:hypothetical protein